MQEVQKSEVKEGGVVKEAGRRRIKAGRRWTVGETRVSTLSFLSSTVMASQGAFYEFYRGSS